MDIGTKKTIHEAVQLYHVSSIRNILERDSSCVNEWNLEGKTPLHMIYSNEDHTNSVKSSDRLLVMQLLVDYGADLNTREGRMDESVLHFAVKNNKIDEVKFLLERNADPEVKNKWGYTPLHLAVEISCKEIITLLLNHKANLNINNRLGQTPVDHALARHNFNSLKILVELGVKSSNIYKNIFQVCNGFLGPPDRLFVEYLLEHASELDGCGNFSLEALLYYFEVSYEKGKNHTERGESVFLQVLQEKGICYHKEVENSELHLAVLNGSVTVVEDLLRKGINAGIKNKYDETPLHFAVRELDFGDDKKLCLEIAGLLIQHGSDLHAQNFLDETPLFLAIKTGSKQLVDLMLVKIAGFDQTTVNNLTGVIYYSRMNFFQDNPKVYELVLATDLGCEEVVDRLLHINFNNEADKSMCKNINAVLQVAILSNRYRILKIFLEAGFRTDGCFTCNTPRFYKSYKEDTLKIACLLWEFKDNAIINRAINDVLCFIDTRRFTNKFIYLLVFFHVINLRTNNLSAQLIPAKKLFEIHSKLATIISDCNRQLDALKEEKIVNTSVFHIVTMPFNLFVKRLDDEQHFSACSEYRSLLEKKECLEYYEFLIKFRIDLAMERREVLSTATSYISSLLEHTLKTTNLKKLPHEIVWNILTRFNMRELRSFAKTMEITK